MSIDKIGMYSTDEILEFMTEGEGRGFLGRSMFDAMYFEIERLNNELELQNIEMGREIERLHSIIKEVREYIEHAQNYGKEKILYINGNDILEILERVNNDK